MPQLSQLKERVQSTTNNNILERLNAINYPLEKDPEDGVNDGKTVPDEEKEGGK